MVKESRLPAIVCICEGPNHTAHVQLVWNCTNNDKEDGTEPLTYANTTAIYLDCSWHITLFLLFVAYSTLHLSLGQKQVYSFLLHNDFCKTFLTTNTYDKLWSGAYIFIHWSNINAAWRK